MIFDDVISQVRPDGSRYIARRPTRTFLLRQRERQIAEERTGELTTDNEDAASEVKVGKFWTKEQRRKHVEDGRERRRRQEEMIRAKNLTKTSSKDAVETRLSQLAEEEKVEEIARMLGGVKITSKTLATAREMLEN